MNKKCLTCDKFSDMMVESQQALDEFWDCLLLPDNVRGKEVTKGELFIATFYNALLDTPSLPTGVDEVGTGAQFDCWYDSIAACIVFGKRFQDGDAIPKSCRKDSVARESVWNYVGSEDASGFVICGATLDHWESVMSAKRVKRNDDAPRN